MQLQSTAEDLANTLALGTDFDKRTIYIVGEIDDEIAYKTMISLDKLSEEKLPIRIVMLSEGGAVDAGCAIYDAIRACGVPVVIDGYGEVASIAAFIMQAATIRRMSPETRFMIHDGSIALGEIVEAGKLLRITDEFQVLHKRYKEVLAERSGLLIEEVAAASSKETYFSAEQCLGVGFIDEIVRTNDWVDCLRNPKKWIKAKEKAILQMKVVHDVKKLSKALEGGPYDPNRKLVAGAPLKVEDLSPVMRTVTFKDKHIKLRKKPRKKTQDELLQVELQADADTDRLLQEALDEIPPKPRRRKLKKPAKKTKRKTKKGRK